MTKPKPLPSQTLLRSLFDYDEKTGIVTRKTSLGGCVIGEPVGSPDTTGYLRVRINKIEYKIHRVIWVWMTGNDPMSFQVDHINRKRSDNRWENLRLLNHSQNKLNHGGYKNNKSGISCINWDSSRNLWRVEKNLNGKKKYIGRFASFEEAKIAVRAWDAR